VFASLNGMAKRLPLTSVNGIEMKPRSLRSNEEPQVSIYSKLDVYIH